MMTENRTLPDKFSSLTGNVKDYVRLKIELYKLMAAEGLAQVIGHLLITLVLFLLCMFLLFFLSLTFIYWFGEEIGHTYVGAMIVVAFYLVASVIVYLFRYRIFVNPLISKLSGFFSEEGGNDEE